MKGTSFGITYKCDSAIPLIVKGKEYTLLVNENNFPEDSSRVILLNHTMIEISLTKGKIKLNVPTIVDTNGNWAYKKNIPIVSEGQVFRLIGDEQRDIWKIRDSKTLKEFCNSPNMGKREIDDDAKHYSALLDYKKMHELYEDYSLCQVSETIRYLGKIITAFNRKYITIEDVQAFESCSINNLNVHSFESKVKDQSVYFISEKKAAMEFLRKMGGI